MVDDCSRSPAAAHLFGPARSVDRRREPRFPDKTLERARARCYRAASLAQRPGGFCEPSGSSAVWQPCCCGLATRMGGSTGEHCRGLGHAVAGRRAPRRAGESGSGARTRGSRAFVPGGDAQLCALLLGCHASGAPRSGNCRRPDSSTRDGARRADARAPARCRCSGCARGQLGRFRHCHGAALRSSARRG